MVQPLRGGVIGAGVFGGYHAGQYQKLPGVTLAGVLDHHRDRAEQVAESRGAKAFDDLATFLAAVDVVTVASPATLHAEHALAAIDAGKSVYVEKPIAVRVADAERVRDAAAAKGLVVACGHQERVVFQVMGLLDAPEQPLRLEAIRRGPPSDRSRDVSAILDLMIHDLDLALALSVAKPINVTASGEKGADGVWDVAQAQITFDDGFVATFDVSRQAPERRRTMRVVYPSGVVEIDFVARTFHNTTPFPLNADFADTPAAADPLGASVAAFLMAVRGTAPRPVVDVEEAIAALALALEVEAALAKP